MNAIRNEHHYRGMFAFGASANPQLAASAVYAVRHGHWGPADAHTDEYGELVREFRTAHGDTVPADVILSAMDSARRAERYGKLVRGWDWRKELEDAGVKASDLFEQMVAQIAEQLADE